jgi:hypothetical protein
MQNKIIEVNEETLKMVAEMVPDTKNPMKLMSYAMNLMNSIKLVINNDLEYGEFRVREETEDEKRFNSRIGN